MELLLVFKQQFAKEFFDKIIFINLMKAINNKQNIIGIKKDGKYYICKEQYKKNYMCLFLYDLVLFLCNARGYIIIIKIVFLYCIEKGINIEFLVLVLLNYIKN